jgi:hypothetical protein
MFCSFVVNRFLSLAARRFVEQKPLDFATAPHARRRQLDSRMPVIWANSLMVVLMTSPLEEMNVGIV